MNFQYFVSVLFNYFLTENLREVSKGVEVAEKLYLAISRELYSGDLPDSGHEMIINLISIISTRIISRYLQKMYS